MNDSLKHLMEDDMKKLPFVEWDRFYEGKAGTDLFGWIAREDTHEDFVVLSYKQSEKGEPYWDTTFSTSSEKYSKRIAELLDFEDHNNCKRVEHIFSSVANCIRL